MRVRVYSRVGCHLCDQALAVVARVVGTDVEVVDVDTDPELVRRYGEEVPVVLVDGRQIAYWRVEESALRAALARRPA
jgi:glutaredoxin